MVHSIAILSPADGLISLCLNLLISKLSDDERVNTCQVLRIVSVIGVQYYPLLFVTLIPLPQIQAGSYSLSQKYMAEKAVYVSEKITLKAQADQYLSIPVGRL